MSSVSAFETGELLRGEAQRAAFLQKQIEAANDGHLADLLAAYPRGVPVAPPGQARLMVTGAGGERIAWKLKARMRR
jgi:hypothetical protein